MQFIIAGDSERYGYKDCLVYVLGSCTKEKAEEYLKEFTENPDDNKKRIAEGMTNLRLETVDEDDCWWDKENLD